MFAYFNKDLKNRLTQTIINTKRFLRKEEILTDKKDSKKFSQKKD